MLCCQNCDTCEKDALYGLIVKYLYAMGKCSKASCRLCNKEIDISSMSEYTLVSHARAGKHKNLVGQRLARHWLVVYVKD